METNLCGTCNRPTPSTLSPLTCWKCNKTFHKMTRCSNLDPGTFQNIFARNFGWLCCDCSSDAFPFSNLDTNEIIDLFSVDIQIDQPKPNKKTKCNLCTKKVNENAPFVYCTCCSKFYHKRCSDTKTCVFPLSKDWRCNKCSINSLPFSSITDDGLLLNLQGISGDSAEFVSNLPSFSIQSLLDQLPGQNFNTDDFLSESIESKYYSPAQFISQKFSKNSFTIAHLNIASLQGHIDELRTLLTILDHPFDILCITETRLHDRDPLVNIQIPGYNFVHKETTTQCGGVGIFIKTGIEYEELNLTSSQHNVFESIFIEIKNDKKKNVVIGCIYRHPRPVADFLDSYFEEMLEKVANLNKTCALLGDFNIDLIKYGDNHHTDSFYDQISSHGFRPLILQPSRVTSSSATLIDNIFINDIQCFSKGGNITSSISDHFLQFSQMDIFDNFKKQAKADKFSRNWAIFNKREFEDEVSQINWDEVIPFISNTDQSFKKFYDTVTKKLDEMAPIKKLTKKEKGLKNNPWITHGILKSMRQRDTCYKKFVKEKDPLLKQDYHKQYKLLRNHIVLLIRISKKDYYAKYFEEQSSNIKKTWDGIRDLINVSKKSSKSLNKVFHDGKFVTSNKDIASVMNKFFTNIGSSVEAKIPPPKKAFSEYLTNPNPLSIAIHLCTPEEVLDIINNFSTSKSCGPFSIPSKILKEFSQYLVPPIVTIINKSLLEGVFPDSLKLALVCAIFKKGDDTKCANYRPISLLSNISKIFERIMYNRVEYFLNEHELIYELQFGFRKKFSTNHALLSIVESIRSNLDKKTFSCGVFVDLEKAFDTVNHTILLSKLNHYGIRGPSLEWFRSYLTNRKQCTKSNGFESKYLDINCGVPQGSILGPLLFLIYINDMHSALKKCIVHHFADDTNLLFSHKDPEVIRKTMNKELQLLYDWLCANRLSLNVNKTEFIIFRPPGMKLQNRVVLTLNNVKIHETRKIKYLGLLMDDRLSWKFHINELCKKLGRSVGMLYKIRHLCPKSVLRSLYFSLFHSHLSYGLPVWGNADQIYIEKLAILQKKAIRCISFSDYKAHSLPLLKDLKILSLQDLLKYQTSSIMWDLDHNLLPEALSTYFVKRRVEHDHATRIATSDKLTIKSFNTTKYGHKSFQKQGAVLLNDLKDQEMYVNARSKNSFLNQLKESILSTY